MVVTRMDALKRAVSARLTKEAPWPSGLGRRVQAPSSATHVDSQVVCLLPVGIFNLLRLIICFCLFLSGVPGN